nr:hypothetical protein [Tanacetum cinerariifolium]
MASMNTRLNIENLDGNIVQKHGEHVWFEVELQGAQRDRENEGFQVSNDYTVVAQRRLEDKQPEEKTNTNCLIKEQKKDNATERYREDSNEDAFAVAVVEKIYAHESLTFNDTVACKVLSKWKDGLKEDMDVRKSSDESHDITESMHQFDISRHARIMYANGHLVRDYNFSYDGIDLPHMEKSTTVVDNVTNTSKDSRLRTSSGKFVDRGQDETIRAIRLHFLTCSSEGLTGICDKRRPQANLGDHMPSRVYVTKDSIMSYQGSKEETYFDSEVGFDSDCESDSMSVNGGTTSNNNDIEEGFNSISNNNGISEVAPAGNGADVTTSIESLLEVKEHYEISVYGFFLGKRVAYLVIENYVKNTWSRSGLVHPMMNSKGIFFFKIILIRSWNLCLRMAPLIHHKWSLLAKVSKEGLKSVPIWNKLHDVPITSFAKDELSVIATKHGTH